MGNVRWMLSSVLPSIGRCCQTLQLPLLAPCSPLCTQGFSSWQLVVLWTCEEAPLHSPLPRQAVVEMAAAEGLSLEGPLAAPALSLALKELPSQVHLQHRVNGMSERSVVRMHNRTAWHAQ
jgi:hypothetical protein